jgi:hypothetical protein
MVANFREGVNAGINGEPRPDGHAVDIARTLSASAVQSTKSVACRTTRVFQNVSCNVHET